MRATAPCGPTVIPYSLRVGPLGFVGAAARPGGENRIAGAVRSWEKMFAATMASYLGAGDVLVGATSRRVAAGSAGGAVSVRGTDMGARRSPSPATRNAAAAAYSPRTSVRSRSLRSTPGTGRAGGATRREVGAPGPSAGACA